MDDLNRRGGHISVLLTAIFLPLLVFGDPTDELVTRARALARSGKEHRGEALSLLNQQLEQAPEDSEARVLYGIVLSWEGKYDAARKQLSQVLAKKPDHADALLALINLELWSDHPQRADQLAADALSRQPQNVDLLLARAQALRNMNRPREAIAVLDRVLVLDSRNQEAKRLRRALSRTTSKWEASVTHFYDWFSDGRDAQHETSIQLRAPSPAGSIIGRVNRADRFSLVSYQTEVDFYPHIRPGTYGYLNVGYSADGNLYPTYRVGADLFQSVGHGFEVSGGYRHLDFSSGINIYTFAMAKYYNNWLFTGRGFLTPDQTGISRTGVFSARRFFSSEGQHDYVEVRYSHGASPALARTTTDVLLLDSSRFAVEIDKALGSRWIADFGGGISQEQRPGLSHLRRYSLHGSVYYRF